MVKKAKKKSLSPEDKKNKTEKLKSKKKQEKEVEQQYEEDEDEEEEENDEEDEEIEGFIDNEEEEDYGATDRAFYLDEKKFIERDKKEALKKLKGRINEDDDEKVSDEDEKEDNNKEDEDEKPIDDEEISQKIEESESELSTKRPKKKRKLHKVIDNEELRREYNDLKDEPDVEENLSVKKEESLEEEDESNIKNKTIKKNRNDSEDYEVPKNKNRNNRDDDFIVYGDRRPRRQKDLSKTEKIQLMDQDYLTKEDKIIINEDYPERLLRRYKFEELPTLYQEIKPEVDWICEQKNYTDSPNKKKKVVTFLELYKKEFLDIPYIITYRYYLFEHEMQIKDLWEIYELDKEYQKLMDFKKKVMNNFNALESFLNEKLFHNMKEKCIENAKTIQDLNNMMNYINFIKEKNNSSNSKSENKYQGPIRKSFFNVLFTENLEKCSQQFCLEPSDIASNIELIRNKENLSKLLKPPEPDCSLTELLQNCKPPSLQDTQFMENMCILIGKEMISHPYIKEFVYEYLRNNCYISTNPTEEGQKQLDVFHPSFRTKRIRDQPIKTFSEDDLFLDIIQREKEQLIIVNIQIKEKEEESKDFKNIFTLALNGEQNNINENNYGIKQEKDPIDDLNFNSSSNNKSNWYILRENVIKIFFEQINKQFLIDIKKELTEKAEAYVINLCGENFYKLLMSGPYVINVSDLYEDKKKDLENAKKKKKNNEEKEKEKNKKTKYYNVKDFEEEEEIIDETDAKFRDDQIPKVMSFIYDTNENITYCVALNQNGEVLDEKIFNFNFARKNKIIPLKQSQDQEKEKDPLSTEEERLMKFLEEHDPNLIVIGANDLRARFIKDRIIEITCNKNFSLQHHYRYITFGDMSIPSIFSNSPISEEEFPKYNMYVKQAISLGRYHQNPLQEILQLWKEDLNENYCLKIKLHAMQKYVNQYNLMQKLETKAIEVVNLCGFDLNKAYEFRHLRNTLMFISGFGPLKAKNFFNILYSKGKPKTREEILEDKNYNIGPKVGVSFINFIKIKTDIKEIKFEDECNLLDMTRIPIEYYDMTKKFISDALKKDDNNKKQKKKKDDEIEEIIRYPKKLEVLDLNEYIKRQSENLKGVEIDKLKFSLKLIKEELTDPFRDLRNHREEDFSPKKIFHLLIGDDNFQEGAITVAKVIRIDAEHVQCKLQNDLTATVWFKDIFDDLPENEKLVKEKVKSLYKPGSVFEARIKTIDYNTYKVDLVTKPSEMISHKRYIPNLDKIQNFFELKDEDKKNIPYINAHSQKHKKYQPRNIKFEKFKNISYADCCNYLRNKEIGECVFRPSSIGNNNLTLSYKFYKQIICHLDIIEEDKQQGDSIGRKLKISSETYSSLDEILKRYVVPCGQYIRESIKNRKFVHCDTKTDFENKLKADKKKQTSIINYNYTILKDYPGYIVLGYVPKVNPIYEYIKIKPKGLYFHEKLFPSLDDITNYFKKEYSTDAYREKVRRSVIPTIQYHRNIETNNNIFNFDDSGNKYNNFSKGTSIGLKEGSYHGNSRNKEEKLCNICQRPGHIAKYCKNRESYNNDRRRDNNRNNNSGYLGEKRNRDRDNWDRDNNELKKERQDNRGWRSNNRDRENRRNRDDENNRNFKRDKEDEWDNKSKDNDDGWGSPDKNKKDKDGWGSPKNDDDGWGNDNNENQNNNFKSENNNNDGW